MERITTLIVGRTMEGRTNALLAMGRGIEVKGSKFVLGSFQASKLGQDMVMVKPVRRMEMESTISSGITETAESSAQDNTGSKNSSGQGPVFPGWDKLLHINDENYKSIFLEHKELFVMFHAKWCGHCKTIKPIFAELALSLNQSVVNHTAENTNSITSVATPPVENIKSTSSVITPTVENTNSIISDTTPAAENIKSTSSAVTPTVESTNSISSENTPPAENIKSTSSITTSPEENFKPTNNVTPSLVENKHSTISDANPAAENIKPTSSVTTPTVESTNSISSDTTPPAEPIKSNSSITISMVDNIKPTNIDTPSLVENTNSIAATLAACDTDASPSLVDEFQLIVLPTFKYVRDGEVFRRYGGERTKEGFMEFLQRMMNEK